MDQKEIFVYRISSLCNHCCGNIQYPMIRRGINLLRRNRKKVWMIISVLFILLLILPPLLDSKIHNYDSPRSAIRAYISDQGYPYQSFFAIIRSKDVYDETYGNKYDVIWNPWKYETGMIPTICYTKKIKTRSITFPVVRVLDY